MHDVHPTPLVETVIINISGGGGVPLEQRRGTIIANCDGTTSCTQMMDVQRLYIIIFLSIVYDVYQ